MPDKSEVLKTSNRPWRKRIIAGSLFLILGVGLAPSAVKAQGVSFDQVFSLVFAYLGTYTDFIEDFVKRTGGTSLNTSVNNYLNTFADIIPSRFSGEAEQALRNTRNSTPDDDPVYDTSKLLKDYNDNIANSDTPVSLLLPDNAAIRLEVGNLTSEALKMTGNFMTASGGGNITEQMESFQQLQEIIQALHLLNQVITPICLGAGTFGSNGFCGVLTSINNEIEAIKGQLQAQMSAVEVKQRHAVDVQLLYGAAAQLDRLNDLVSLAQYEAASPRSSLQGNLPTLVGASAAPPQTNDNDFRYYR
jgi:hypothetical protein